LTQDALKVQSEFRRENLLLEPKGSGDPEVDLEVWKQTLEERDKGWLVGPALCCVLIGFSRHTDDAVMMHKTSLLPHPD
jgi:hypothetical protein